MINIAINILCQIIMAYYKKNKKKSTCLMAGQYGPTIAPVFYAEYDTRYILVFSTKWANFSVVFQSHCSDNVLQNMIELH